MIQLVPTKQQLSEIENWLFEEQNKTGEGFYCNWSIIRNNFQNKTLAVVSDNDKAVGFCCWRHTSTRSGQINIFQIHPDHRNNGIGTQFVKELLSFFINSGLYAIDLQCVPESSESFWKRFGFINAPDNIYYWDKQTIHLYKTLIPDQTPTIVERAGNYIEVWDAEPYQAEKKIATWQWQLKRKSAGKKLDRPIIIPCVRDWRIHWVNEGKIIVDNKIKRFGIIDVDFGPYLILSELPALQ